MYMPLIQESDKLTRYNMYSFRNVGPGSSGSRSGGRGITLSDSQVAHNSTLMQEPALYVPIDPWKTDFSANQRFTINIPDFLINGKKDSEYTKQARAFFVEEDNQKRIKKRLANIEFVENQIDLEQNVKRDVLRMTSFKNLRMHSQMQNANFRMKESDLAKIQGDDEPGYTIPLSEKAQEFADIKNMRENITNQRQRRASEPGPMYAPGNILVPDVLSPGGLPIIQDIVSRSYADAGKNNQNANTTSPASTSNVAPPIYRQYKPPTGPIGRYKGKGKK
jgi:hypothetical protein